MSATPLPAGATLMGFWSRHKADCRPTGDIVSDARSGNLAGVTPLPSGLGFAVVDEATALAAMKGAS